MSIRVMSRVWESSSQSGGALLVLLALADFANDEGYCYPSVATLARKSRLSERQVQRTLQSLATAGEIEIAAKAGAKQAGDGGGFTNRYRVTCHQSEGCKNVTPQKRGVTFATERGDICDIRGVTPMSPKPSGEEPSLEPSVVYNAREHDDVVDIFTPEELYSEPLPQPAPKAQQQREKEALKERRLSIMAAYRSARFGKPLSSPIAPAEFSRMCAAADDLLEAGVTPEQVAQATEAGLLRASEDKFVTLKYVAGALTELLTPIKKPAPAPRSTSAQRYTPSEQRFQREKAKITEQYEQLAAIEMGQSMALEDPFALPEPPPIANPHRVIVRDSAFERPARRIN